MPGEVYRSSTDREPTPVEQPSFTTWFRGNVAPHLVTMIIGGLLGFVPSWYLTKAAVEEHERRITALESTSVKREEVQNILQSINQRLGNIEQVLMHSK